MTIDLLHLLPDEDSTLDITSLEGWDMKLPLNILDALGNEKQLSLKINVPQSLPADDYRTIFFKNLTASGKSLKIGYPFVSFGEVGEMAEVTAPILIWEGHISITDDNALLLEANGKNATLNPELNNYYMQRYGYQLSALLTDTLGSGLNKVAAFANSIVANTGVRGGSEKAGLAPFPQEALPQSIQWSGALWFETTPIEQEIAESIALNVPPPTGIKWRSPTGALATDTWQDLAFTSLQENGKVLITGAPGAGKTHTLAAILTRALTDGQRVLYISSQPESVQQVSGVLSSLNLDEFMLILQDGIWDKARLIGELRKVPEAIKKIPAVDEYAFSKQERKARIAMESLRSHHETLHAPLLHGMGWPAVVGTFLQINKLQSKHLLASRLDSADFAFNDEEFERLKEEVVEHEPLYRAIGTLSHPLEPLEDTLFISGDMKEREKELRAHLNLFTNKATKLYHCCASMIEEYADSLEFHYRDHVRQLREYRMDLEQDLFENSADYGNDFDKWNALTNIKTRLFGIFSNRSRALRVSREHLLRKYDGLQALLNERNYLSHPFAKLSDNYKSEEMKKALENFEQSLANWEKSIPALVRADALRLNNLTSTAGPKFKRRTNEFQEEFKQFLSDMNASGIFEKKYETNAVVFSIKRDFLGQIVEELTTFQFHMREFEPYFLWKKHTVSLSREGQLVVNALVKVKPSDWLLSFESWYMDQLMAKHRSLDVPHYSYHAESLLSEIQTYRQMLPAKVANACRRRQADTLGYIKRKEKETNKLLFGKKSHETLDAMPLSEIARVTGSVLADFFPAMLVSEDLFEQMYEVGTPLPFDLVLLDDSGLLTSEAVKSIIGQDKPLAIAGGENAFRGSALVTANEAKMPHTRLQYRSRTEESFENDPAYQLKETIVESLRDYFPHHLFQVNVQPINGIFVDILLKPTSGSTGKPVAIFCDGLLGNHHTLSFEKTSRHFQRLRSAGHIVLSTWSYDWWENAELAAEKLAKAVETTEPQAIEAELVQ